MRYGEGKGGAYWGHFNSIKSISERKGVEGYNRSKEMNGFKEFITESGLIDLPLIDRKYTWYKADGSTMSRLDRFLITEEWLSTWRNVSQWGLKISVSDHCAMVLKIKETNWGPKPFCMLKCLEQMEGYEEFVKKGWSEFQVSGWKGYMLKEKLKGVKNKLKTWNREHCGNLDSKISEAKDELLRLDLKGEEGNLLVEEVVQRRLCVTKIHVRNSRKCSLLWQKS